MELDAGMARPRRTRRFRSPEERCRIVEQTLVPGVSVATVARAHELNPNLVFHWRKLYHAGVLRRESSLSDEQRMLPVAISDADEVPRFEVASIATSAASSGSMEVTLAKGQIRIKGAVDASALRTVIECLRGDRSSVRHAHLDRGGRHRHAARLYRVERTGPDGARTAAPFRPCVRLWRAARR